MNLALLLAVAARLLFDAAHQLAAIDQRGEPCPGCGSAFPAPHDAGCHVARLISECTTAGRALDDLIAGGAIFRIPVIGIHKKVSAAIRRYLAGEIV